MAESKKLGAVIAVGNQKGGVGKSTNTTHIAAALGQRGMHCLIIDLDPGAGSTKLLGVPVDSFSGSLELLTTDETIQSLAISDKMPVGVHLIPSRPQLSEIDSQLSKFVDRTRILDRPLNEARERYDFIFLDTGHLAAFTTTVAAYSSAEWFLLSAFAHPLSLGGLTDAFNDIADSRKHRNPSLEILGVVFTAGDERTTRLRNRLEAAVAEALPGRQFETAISQAIIVPDVSDQGRTLFQLPKFRAIPTARQYLRLSVEIEHRVRHRREFLEGTMTAADFSVLSEILGHGELLTELRAVNG